MSFDYISDLFGRYRCGRKTKFADIESRAITLLRNKYQGMIAGDEFAEAFGKVLKDFLDLSGNVIDQDTPMWISIFGANVFARWRNWYFVKRRHAERPEEFSAPGMEERYREIEAMRLDDWFESKIRYCLDELDEK